MSSLSNSPRRQTLKNFRLRKHAEFVRAYAAGRKRQSANMSWFLAPQSAEDASGLHNGRVGLTVGKAIGKAHQRNRIKRRMREALRRRVDLVPQGFDLIFHPRPSVLTVEFAELEREILRILETAGKDAARGARTAVDPLPVRMASAS